MNPQLYKKLLHHLQNKKANHWIKISETSSLSVRLEMLIGRRNVKILVIIPIATVVVPLDPRCLGKEVDQAAGRSGRVCRICKTWNLKEVFTTSGDC